MKLCFTRFTDAIFFFSEPVIFLSNFFRPCCFSSNEESVGFCVFLFAQMEFRMILWDPILIIKAKNTAPLISGQEIVG